MFVVIMPYRKILVVNDIWIFIIIVEISGHGLGDETKSGLYFVVRNFSLLTSTNDLLDYVLF